MVGAVLGLGLAAVREISDAVVRQEQDIEGLVSARVLVGIPHLTTPGEDRFHSVYRWLEIGTVSLMALLILAGNLYAFYKS